MKTTFPKMPYASKINRGDFEAQLAYSLARLLALPGVDSPGADRMFRVLCVNRDTRIAHQDDVYKAAEWLADEIIEAINRYSPRRKIWMKARRAYSRGASTRPAGEEP